MAKGKIVADTTDAGQNVLTIIDAAQTYHILQDFKPKSSGDIHPILILVGSPLDDEVDFFHELPNLLSSGTPGSANFTKVVDLIAGSRANLLEFVKVAARFYIPAVLIEGAPSNKLLIPEVIELCVPGRPYAVSEASAEECVVFMRAVSPMFWPMSKVPDIFQWQAGLVLLYINLKLYYLQRELCEMCISRHEFRLSRDSDRPIIEDDDAFVAAGSDFDERVASKVLRCIDSIKVMGQSMEAFDDARYKALAKVDDELHFAVIDLIMAGRNSGTSVMAGPKFKSMSRTARIVRRLQSLLSRRKK